jgi:hypothetical protein
MKTDEIVLAMIWMAGGLIAAFTLYSYFSPKIQKPYPQIQAMPAA